MDRTGIRAIFRKAREARRKKIEEYSKNKVGANKKTVTTTDKGSAAVIAPAEAREGTPRPMPRERTPPRDGGAEGRDPAETSLVWSRVQTIERANAKQEDPPVETKRQSRFRQTRESFEKRESTKKQSKKTEKEEKKDSKEEKKEKKKEGKSSKSKKDDSDMRNKAAEKEANEMKTLMPTIAESKEAAEEQHVQEKKDSDIVEEEARQAHPEPVPTQLFSECGNCNDQVCDSEDKKVQAKSTETQFSTEEAHESGERREEPESANNNENREFQLPNPGFLCGCI